tara:strand:+ start:8207 stop:8380 length:174 start_codon:yes stop_codon:yes gene_type:complete
MTEREMIEELCVALERTGTIANEMMLSSLLKDSPISKQIERNERLITQATDLVLVTS